MKLLRMVCVLLPMNALGGTLVCHDKVISPGASQVEVTNECGAPVQVDHTTRKQFVAANQGGAVAGTSTDVITEVWTYNFGTDKLLQRVYFENGVVVRIESAGFGY